MDLTFNYNIAFEGIDYTCYLHPNYKPVGGKGTPLLMVRLVGFFKTNKHLPFEGIEKLIEHQKEKYRRKTILNVVAGESTIELFGSADGVFPIVYFGKKDNRPPCKEN